MFRLPDDKTKFSAKWKYVEIALGRVTSKGPRVFRLQEDDKSSIFHVKDIPELIQKHGDSGFYTSVWQYDSVDVDEAKRFSSLYFDLDDKENPEQAYADAKTLLDYLSQYIPRDSLHLYFTGLKGFHVEAEAIALGISPDKELHMLFRFIANRIKDELGLTTLDFAVYDARRMWRYPNTRNEKSGLYKVEIFDTNMTLEDLKEYAKEPQRLNDKEQSFSYEGCKWYRNMNYEMEAESTKKQLSQAELFNRFSKSGSSGMRIASDEDKYFDPKRLLDSCHAIPDLWDKAERTGHLEHEERLFLCSILSYTDESLEYLYAILSNCNDFNPEISRAHVEDWIRRRDMEIGGRAYSCKTANDKGFGCGDCNLEEKKKWIKSGGVLVQTEETALPSPIRFAYSRKGKSKI